MFPISKIFSDDSETTDGRLKMLHSLILSNAGRDPKRSEYTANKNKIKKTVEQLYSAQGKETYGWFICSDANFNILEEGNFTLRPHGMTIY